MPPDEEKRLEILRQYKILDTEAEKVFDDITKLAGEVCATPISLLTFIDENRPLPGARSRSAVPVRHNEVFCPPIFPHMHRDRACYTPGEDQGYRNQWNP